MTYFQITLQEDLVGMQDQEEPMALDSDQQPGQGIMWIIQIWLFLN